ncbi:MAG: Lrp/AsnC family transcriptional regulator [Phycisphaerales bacterium]
MFRSPPRFSDPSLPPLDEADRRLIELLMADGRASGRDLAQRSGISEANVSRRLARLIEERSIRIAAFVPPELLGFHAGFVVCAKLRGDGEGLAQALLARPEVTWVSTTHGAWDMLAYIVTATLSEASRLVDDVVLAHPAVHHIESRSVVRFEDPWHGITAEDTPDDKRRIDDTDLMIIRQLQHDGRLSFTDIANNTGISATSAADRFRRLVADGLLRIVTIPDPSRVGLGISAVASAQVARPVRAVIADLARIEGAGFFTILTGSHQVGFEVGARDEAHLDAIRAAVLAIPGVQDLSFSIHRTVYRQSFAWGAANGH